MMPDGKIMSDKEMKKMMDNKGKKVKKKSKKY